MATEIDNRLQALRNQIGWSQAELAERAGLSRHTVLAIEQGRMTPSTAIALRLAQVLHCRVEELFWLAEGGPEILTHWHEARPPEPGERVKLAYVGEIWHAHPLPVGDPMAQRTVADGLVRAAVGPSQVAIELLDLAERLRGQLLLAGCDPSLGLLAAHCARRFTDFPVFWLDAPSGRALDLLANNAVHVAGAHLWDAETGAFNRVPVQKAMPGRAVDLIRVARWELGWLTRRGNPKAIRAAADLARPDVTVVNRPPSAGAHLLLERLVRAAGISPVAVRGYDSNVSGHFGVAQAVAMGAADVGVATWSVAKAFDLAFEPLEVEDFDLALPAQFSGDPRLQRLLEVLGSRAFHRELGVVGGYDLATAGSVVKLASD